MNLTNTLLRWLPADSRPGIWKRLGLVSGMTLVIALYIWLTMSRDSGFDVALVYSVAISGAIWFLSDPLRIALRHWFRAFCGPHYWSRGPRTWLYMGLCIVIGYALGTVIGDAYAGHSTWELLTFSPKRFWGIGLSTLLLSLGFNLYFQQRGKAEDLERQATEARLKLLETQLEPHMLFNTLANLRALIQTDPPRAIHMLDRLNDYLRATLKASRTDAVSGGHTLADEFARLRDYLALMAVRMGPRLHHTLELPEALARHPLPPLLLQPLVENAIRHGLEPQVDGGRITVTARREGNHALLIEVADTGAGMPPEPHSPPNSTPPSGGFGLAQVRERVASLPGRAGRVEVSSAPGEGTTIRLHLPLTLPHPTEAP